MGTPCARQDQRVGGGGRRHQRPTFSRKPGHTRYARGCAPGSAGRRPRWRRNFTTLHTGDPGPSNSCPKPGLSRTCLSPRPFTHPCEQPQPRQPSRWIPSSARCCHRDCSATWADARNALPQAGYILGQALQLRPGLRVATKATSTWGSSPGRLLLTFRLQFPACQGCCAPQRMSHRPSHIRSQHLHPHPTPQKMASEAAGTR